MTPLAGCDGCERVEVELGPEVKQPERDEVSCTEHLETFPIYDEALPLLCMEFDFSAAGVGAMMLITHQLRPVTVR